MQKIIKEEHFLVKEILYSRIELDNDTHKWSYKLSEVGVPHHISLKLEKLYEEKYTAAEKSVD